MGDIIVSIGPTGPGIKVSERQITSKADFAVNTHVWRRIVIRTKKTQYSHHRTNHPKENSPSPSLVTRLSSRFCFVAFATTNSETTHRIIFFSQMQMDVSVHPRDCIGA